MRGIHTFLLAFLLLCLTLGCETREPPPASFSVRDSAGVRIVENSSPKTLTAPLHVLSEPVFRVGWAEGDPAFQELSAGVLLSDGRVVAAEADGSAIYFFSEDGLLEERVGGTGEGPGEYREILAIHALPGDSLIVQDPSAVRGTVLDSQGDHVRDFRLPPFSTFEKDGARGMVTNRAVGVSADQHLLFWPYSYAVAGPVSSGWIDGGILKASLEGSSVDTVFSAPFVDHPASGTENPFRLFGAVAVGAGIALYARSDEPQVMWLDQDGAIVQVSRWFSPERPVDDAVWREYAESYLEGLSPEADPARAERTLAERKMAANKVLPVFRTFHADAEGNAWLGEYTVPGTPPRRYTVILHDGSLLGWVDLPSSLTILDITHDRILGVERNQWDVQAIAVYEIKR